MINQLKEDDHTVKGFLKTITPVETKRFYLYGRGNRKTDLPIDISFYLEVIENICKNTHEWVKFNNCYISDSSFQSIIKYCHNTSTVVLSGCKFDLDSLSFLGPSYSIKTLDFIYSGDRYSNNWKEEKNKFRAIVKAISECTLKDSLKQLSIKHWGIKREMAKQTLEQYGLYDVYVDYNYANW